MVFCVSTWGSSFAVEATIVPCGLFLLVFWEPCRRGWPHWSRRSFRHVKLMWQRSVFSQETSCCGCFDVTIVNYTVILNNVFVWVANLAMNTYTQLHSYHRFHLNIIYTCLYSYNPIRFGCIIWFEHIQSNQCIQQFSQDAWILNFPEMGPHCHPWGGEDAQKIWNLKLSRTFNTQT